MSDGHEQAGATTTAQAQPSDEEMRAAYEAELNRITSSEMILQTAVSLLNIGGRRLGLGAPSSSSTGATTGERDLEQVRDAIDGASALLPILERRMPRELGPLRDAIAQLQVAYAREAQGSGNTTSTAAQAPAAQPLKPTEKQKSAGDGQDAGEQPGPTEQQGVSEQQGPTEQGSGEPQGPGPAQASGRLWVPGR